MGRCLLLAALLLGASLPATARDYVLTWTNGGTTYYVGMNGNNIAVKTDFDVTCIWSCRNGNNDANLGNTSYSLRNKNNPTYFLSTSCTRSGDWWSGYTYSWNALIVQNSANNIWRSSNGSNGNIYAYSSGGSDWYSWDRSATIRVVNGAWAMYDNNNDGSQNSQVTTTTPGASSPTTAEIGTLTVTPLTAVLYQSENETFTASASVTVTNYSIPAHTKYTFTIGSTNYEYFYYNNTRYTSIEDFSTKTTTTQTPNYAWSKTGDDGSNASLSSTNTASTTVTHATQAAADKSITLTVTASYSGSESKTANVNVVLYGPMVAPSITRSGNSISIATTNIGATIYYTIDESNPTVSSTEYTGEFDLTTSPTIVKAIAIRDGHNSTVTSETFYMQLPTPVITVSNTGLASIAPGAGSPAGTTIHYTIDGTTPTESSATYSTAVQLTNPQIIKAIAILTNYDNSAVASADFITSGISGTNVILDDREDHSWSYYSDATLPSQMRSLNPADVKITYFGNGEGTVSTTDGVTPADDSWTADATGVKVSPGEVDPAENQNTFIYYKTLERTDGSTSETPTGRCAYTVIPNPFQVRPVYSTASTRTIYVQWAKTNSGTGTLVINYINGAGEETTFTQEYTAQDSKNLYIKMGTDFSYSLTCTGTQNNSTATVTIKLDGSTGTQIRQHTANKGETVSGVCNTRLSDASGYRGFYKWRIKEIKNGAIYTAATDGTEKTAYVNGNYSEDNCLDAEKTYYFAPSGEYNMEVQLEALWARAYVVSTGNSSSVSVGSYSVGCERNFVVIEKSSTNFDFSSAITDQDYPFTVSRFYPNGATGTLTGSSITGTVTLAVDTKFENINLYNITTLNANNHNLTVGRNALNSNGGGSVTTVKGHNHTGNNAFSTNLNYTIRLESGTYGNFYLIDKYSNSLREYSGRVTLKAVLGCDYDRAKNDNNKLHVAPDGEISAAEYITLRGNSNKDQLVFDWNVKSGQMQENQLGNAAAEYSIYIGAATSTRYVGKKRILVEGGEMASIAGGIDSYSSLQNNGYTTSDTYVSDDLNDQVYIRITNNDDTKIRGAIYGAAAYAGSRGGRKFVITGGTINGWIAGGCNGTQSSGGQLYGTTYMYIGGNAHVEHADADPYIGGTDASYGTNGAYGGNIFGAGCGIRPNGYNANDPGATLNNATVGKVYGSKIALADNLVVSRDVYGGGNFGQVADNSGTWSSNSDMTSDIYILGGDIRGNVYGGSNNQQGQTVNITMKGGLVESGIYGGSNTWGTINKNVTMHIDGGQVGVDNDHRANIHGGGYGVDTRVLGSVNLSVGKDCNATSGALIYGDVYGGSAEGRTNGNTSLTSGAVTNVNLYKGTIYGALYGGGLGTTSPDHPAYVYGPVAVKVYGGSVRTNDGTGENGSGGVFGCNNANGTPQSTVTVDIYGTDPAEPGQDFALYAVYGGGNRSNYTSTPKVNIHGCNNLIEYVYGGGNASNVAGTDVTIWGGHIGNAFAGGNGFSVTRNHTNAAADHYNPGANITTSGTQLTIHGGQIDAAFGGSNQYGTINGGITVEVEAAVENANDPCSGNAYTACDEMFIAELYGGGNEAPIQTSGGTWIVPSVTLDCSAKVGMLFGGAKAADYTGDINLVVNGGTFEKVFGGNNMGGTITGNVTVTFNGGSAKEVYGGCNQSGTITGTVIVNIDSTTNSCNPKFYVENVYGGGNMAAYSHPSNNYPEVNIKNGTVRENVYGGGYGATATVTGDPMVTVGVSNDKKVKVLGSVFGGGNAAPVVGDTTVKILYKSRVFGNIYGGGNEGEVQGDTKVIVNQQ